MTAEYGRTRGVSFVVSHDSTTQDSSTTLPAMSEETASAPFPIILTLRSGGQKQVTINPSKTVEEVKDFLLFNDPSINPSEYKMYRLKLVQPVIKKNNIKLYTSLTRSITRMLYLKLSSLNSTDHILTS